MNRKPLIIAEAGVNHNGSLDLALEMVEAAAISGADFVKFQTFDARRLVTLDAPRAEYQQRNTGEASNQYEMLRRLELSEADFAAIARRCHRCHIGFMSTPFDIEAVDMLERIGQEYWKIPSGEITNLPLLRRIARTRGRVIMSTGMSSLDEVGAAVDALVKAGTSRSDIILLHCTTAYPAPLGSVNLLAMNALRTFGTGGIGYSDHTRGIAVPIATAALGAVVIEKHFTLDRSLPGPDHRASLTPDELTEMVRAIRDVTAALGSTEKGLTDIERPNLAVARKSIVARKAIRRGEILSDENMTTKRPGTGLSPMLWDRITGTVATRNYEPDQQIEPPSEL